MIQGQTLCGLSRRPEGEAALREADSLIPAASSSLRAELAFSRGICAFSSPAQARQYFEQAAELANSTDPFIAASALVNIGYLYGSEGRHDEAVEWLQKSVPLLQTAKSRLLEEKTLGNLGTNYSELGDYKRAIENSEQAQRIAKEIGRTDDEEFWLVDLGRSYAALPGDYPGKAEESYLQVQAIAQGLQDAATLRKCLHNLAQLSIKEHAPDKGQAYLNQEKAVVVAGRAYEVDTLLDEAEIALARKDLTTAEHNFQEIIKDPGPLAVRCAIAQGELGQVYSLEHKPQLADQMFRDGIRTVEAQLAKTKLEYWVTYLDQFNFFDPYIRFLVEQNKKEQALQVAEHLRSLAQNTKLGKEPGLNIPGIQRTLAQRHQIILDYRVTDDETLLWVITPTEFQVFHLPPHEALFSLIDTYNTSIQEQRGINDSFGGKELYKALIQPAEKLLPKGSQVLIVPSKILCLLNFETLVVSGNKPHYWIEDVTVQNLNMLSQALSPVSAPVSAKQDLLLMGAPQEVNAALPTLKHAGEEIDRVKSHFSTARTSLFVGANATPQAYQSSTPLNYRYIHFVTHGIANEKVPMESAIVLSGNNGSFKLYARDIIPVPLNADLVTVSACYGAGKRWYTSEGTVGLGWAFLRAGARQVIAALWEVDDTITPKLMDDLYTELKQGKSPAVALRDAKLKLALGDHSSPYYWASLQLYSR